MKYNLSLKKKSLLLEEFGFSLLESIFVLLISSIILSIAIPKLELPIRNSIDRIKLYSKLGFNSLRNSMNVSKEFELLGEKLKIRSYLFAARNLYMFDSIHPYSAGDLQGFTKVTGCQISKTILRDNNSRVCQKLSNDLSVTSWESLNRNFLVKMYSQDEIFNMHSIPLRINDKGVLGCFNSRTGAMNIKIFKKESPIINTFQC